VESAIPATPFPAVLKPIDGCGSQGVRRIDRAEDLGELSFDRPHRLERFVPGMAASVAVLCGLELLVALPACEQRLTDDGRFSYLGGRTPLAPALDERARRLALAAVRTLPEPLGYVGVDLVLGDDPHGAADYVIEINPRLTTSYIGLRAACRDNLAAAMLAVAEGRQPSLEWHDGAVEFSADGRVRHT
jgi:predicted ATP-grasp superfamily ATP-dependent carboligase